MNLNSLPYAIQVIDGNILFSNNSYIYDQPYLINGYLSNILIGQAIIQDTEDIKSLASVIASNLTLNDNLIRNMSGSNGGVIVEAAFDSSSMIQNLTFKDSSIQLGRIISSRFGIAHSTINSITLSNELINVLDGYDV